MHTGRPGVIKTQPQALPAEVLRGRGVLAKRRAVDCTVIEA